MKAARLALSGAYQSEPQSVPPVQDPKHVLDFLHSCIQGGDQSRDISSARRAIDSASENLMSQSWDWGVENIDKLLTGFHRSPYPEEFKWWYGILWLHYGVLDPDVQSRVDEIAMDGDDRVDLKWCRIAVEKEIERVKAKGPDGAVITKRLEGACHNLTAIISRKEKVRDELLGIKPGFISFFPSSRVHRFRLSHGLSIPPIQCWIIGHNRHRPLATHTAFESFPVIFLSTCVL